MNTAPAMADTVIRAAKLPNVACKSEPISDVSNIYNEPSAKKCEYIPSHTVSMWLKKELHAVMINN